MSWVDLGPEKEGNETVKVRARIAPFVSGHGLDLGCGVWPLKVAIEQELGKPPLHQCIGVDGGYSPQACMAAQVIADVSALPMFASEQFDYVYSSHTLEDMVYPEAVLTEWWRVIKPGGKLILYLPLARQVAKSLGVENWHTFYPDKGTPGANSHHEHDYSPQEIKDMVSRVGHAEILADEIRGEKDEYSFLLVWKKLSSSCSPFKGTTPLPEKRALVVRYGAIGDIIQSTPVFKKLKEEGYHVTFNCSNAAKEIIEGNPNVDEISVQIKDYISNQDNNLPDYWKEISKGYDRFCNLTGACEGEVLTADSVLYKNMNLIRKAHPELDEMSVFNNGLDYARKKAIGVNYYDKHLEKAGFTDRGLNGELYFSDAEELNAQGFRAKYSNRFIILWAVSGSSYHKVFPYFEETVKELCVKNPDVLVVSVGDDMSRLLERPPSTKYFPRCGQWTLRTSMIMTKYADLVIGPETGILNAAGCFDTPKITFLSHSTHENFCKYFKNDYCLAPENAFCYPCNTLHYVHTPGPALCVSCNDGTTVHEEVKGAQPPKFKTGGFWSCPYGQSTNGQMFPLCTLGFSKERVLARINEVYKLWSSKKAGLVQVA